MTRLLPSLGLSLLLLVLAVLSGYAVTGRAGVDLSGHLDVFSSGFREMKTFLADLLYLQIDRYHHIITYQGYDWKVITDYLPQLWLVTKLNPGFAEAYVEGGYHLAVNLGYVDEGIELLRSGLINCPDSPEVRWEYAYVCWETGSLPPREQCLSVWDYMRLERRLGISASVIERYTSAMNACRLLWWTFEGYTDRTGSARIAERYRLRVDAMLLLRRVTRESAGSQT